MSAADSPALRDWLDRIERLHPKTIELGLERVREVASRLALSFACPVITVGGTNGKGSTCAMLESILLAAGYRVGLYTSPHFVRFAERARVAGAPVDDADLIAQFEAVEIARGAVALTWFEFTTLAVLRLFARRPLDAVILEVGLGGRLDAVNLIDADCAIVTSIDVDHTEYLGEDRERIGWEKAHVFRPGRPAICSDPSPPAALVDHANAIGADLWLHGRDFNHTGDRQQWAYGGRVQRRSALAYPALRGANQLQNAAGVLAALEALRERLPVQQQAVREGLAAVSLPGRFQVLPGQPVVILDVAHNPHAAAHLAVNLDAMGGFRRTFAVFGVMRDKDVDGVIAALKHRVDHWLAVDLPGPRAASGEWIAARLEAAGIAREGAKTSIECHPDPSSALAAARARASANDRIVVFGSFLTVADILAARAA
ncbi:MAG: bifunctional tetrahydrofolate synthase/dihydrofolate synthase [Burkholderiales bacterium]|nr:bifunctional tetrahydrofolate synthase/dihydrofolate synthase [Burkholderiaceae bacterium]MEB2335339.1 bifunctional tetrahydrofolate synthase/dihydrofolate synthase [Burkholderiales bacterium]